MIESMIFMNKLQLALVKFNHNELVIRQALTFYLSPVAV